VLAIAINHTKATSKQLKLGLGMIASLPQMGILFSCSLQTASLKHWTDCKTTCAVLQKGHRRLHK